MKSDPNRHTNGPFLAYEDGAVEGNPSHPFRNPATGMAFQRWHTGSRTWGEPLTCPGPGGLPPGTIWRPAPKTHDAPDELLVAMAEAYSAFLANTQART